MKSMELFIPHSLIPCPKPDRSERILIVDDDPGMRDLLADMVKGLGHEAIAVEVLVVEG